MRKALLDAVIVEERMGDNTPIYVLQQAWLLPEHVTCTHASFVFNLGYRLSAA
jgi:hypothetical protein